MAASALRELIQRPSDSYRIFTSFDCGGFGSTVAIREAAFENGYWHFIVDLSKATALMTLKEKCVQVIQGLTTKYGSNDERFTPCSGTIVPVLAHHLRDGVICLVHDCLRAMRAVLTRGSMDCGKSQWVYDLVEPCSVESLDSTEKCVTRPYAMMEILLSEEEKRIGGAKRGVIIHVKNSDALFPSDSLPLGELRLFGDDRIQIERAGALMLRSLASVLSCCLGRGRRIVWAFTGTRVGANYSFNARTSYPSVELSGYLECFSVGDVKEVMTRELPNLIMDDSRLGPYWNRLVGPPVVSKLFLDSAATVLDLVREKSCMDSSRALVREWSNIEATIINELHKLYTVDKFDSEAAKLCCVVSLFSFAGQLDTSMSTIHPSLLTIGAGGLLRIRVNPRAERTAYSLYFDRPFPLLLSLFAEKYELPRYALGPLLRANESLRVNSPVPFVSIAEVTFAFEVCRIFEGGPGACLLTSLGLKCLSLNSLSGLKSFGCDDLYVIESSLANEQVNGFQLALKAEAWDGHDVIILIYVSLEEHDDKIVKSAFLRMATAAASYWNKQRVRTFCVFAEPYSEPRVEDADGLCEAILGGLPLCKACCRRSKDSRSSPKDSRSSPKESVSLSKDSEDSSKGSEDSSKGSEESGRLCDSFVSNVCPRNPLVSWVTEIQHNPPRPFPVSLGVPSETGSLRPSTPITLFYLGKDSAFWNSSLLNQLIRDRDRTALTAYLFGLVNPQHVSAQCCKPDEKQQLLVLDMQRVHMNYIGLYGAEPDKNFPRFPANVTDLGTCLSVYLGGHFAPIIASVWVHGITGLSLLNPALLDSTLRLDMSEYGLSNLKEFADEYCLYQQTHGLPDPRKTVCTAAGIAECLRKWGTKELDAVPLEKFLTKCQESVGLGDLTFSMMNECDVLIGAKLAVLNILGLIQPSSRAPTVDFSHK